MLEIIFSGRTMPEGLFICKRSPGTGRCGRGSKFRTFFHYFSCMDTVTSHSAQITSSKPMHRAWSMYDWANSAYNLVITSTIFPAYYNAVTTVTKDGKIVSDQVLFFGHSFKNSSLFDYSIATAYLIIALISPILSSIADYKGNKKRFMQFFCYLGAASCCGLYFFKGNTLELGVICSAIAALGYCGSLVFYNAYLPEIAIEEDRDRVSAQGFAYGYIGSVILQVICFVFVLKPEWFGITDSSFAPRLSFFLVGLWWAGFAQITFFKLPKGRPLAAKPEHSVLANGFFELNKVWSQIKALPVLRTYLGAFFFYSMGVQTVMLAAAPFWEQRTENGNNPVDSGDTGDTACGDSGRLYYGKAIRQVW